MKAPLPTSLWLAVCLCLCLSPGLAAPVALAQENPQVIRITAKRFAFSPEKISVKQGVPVVLELTSTDTTHGFACPGLNIRSDIPSGKVSVVRFTPPTAGEFPFHCDVFCGLGHKKMQGTITVAP
jgi:cytochrome c oxidase subunit II